MKAEELMIGDWVRDKYKPTAHKVESWADFTACDDLTPIPLTPKILKKNGFRNSMLHSAYCSEDDRTEINIYFKSGIDITKNKYLEDEEGFFLPQVYYVHELQRALRCCGLFDLANNLKIE